MSEDIPEWAFDEAAKLCNHGNKSPLTVPHWKAHTAFVELARKIAEHEEPPVDPLLIEAREIAGKTLHRLGASTEQIAAGDITSGKRDDAIIVHATLAALRRGIEIGKADA